MNYYKNIIEYIFDNKIKINSFTINQEEKQAISYIIEQLNTGKLRIAEKINNQWITHQWLKKAVLLTFCLNENQIIENQTHPYFDKIPLKYKNYTQEQFVTEQIRIVPPATVRYGSFIAKNTILMPSYVNIGAYIDTNTMIDTWATIGSCAQIGKNVHISGGVGIGGVLEPLQNNPTIIEDNCFIGARSEIVEGVIIEEGCVISMGVFIGQSTKIYDRENNKILYGKVPKNSVVISGSLPSQTGNCNLYCAVIVKTVDHNTLKKIELNQLLRNIN
ncbi:2,3,4,5-tetrahydropyridine-2,6-dicarboxylate N-succinyltransferase [Buchnera aphidicola (Eriosoma lanigerum)]|uniref:2,3,4,5-tetrahydropyridine-2,6-dicarboxylate N-succinyltransferase n=1 Tax=Buchnera aphidicola TaxID=9 RepID=UPI00346469B6